MKNPNRKKQYKNKGNPDNIYNQLVGQKIKEGYFIFVEGDDDKTFYSKLIKSKFRLNINILPCDGRDNVLEFKNVIDKNYDKDFLFIIDSDYNDNRKYINCPNLVLTTGYSLENFLFYRDDKHDNIKAFLEYYFKVNPISIYHPEITCNSIYNSFSKTLEDYKQHTLEYYGFNMFQKRNKKDIKFYFDYKKQLPDFNKIQECIEKIIPEKIEASANKEAFKQGIVFHKNIINNSGFMFLRGHDVYGLLYNYLLEFEYKFSHNIKKDEILNCSKSIYIPDEFMNKLKTIVNNFLLYKIK